MNKNILKSVLLCSALLVISSCGSNQINSIPVITPIPVNQAAGVALTITEGQFVQGGKISIQLEIDSDVNTNASINLLTQSEIKLSQSRFDVQLKAHERQTFNLEAIANDSGYFTITALGQGFSWEQTQTDMLGFNVVIPNNNTSSTGKAAIKKGGVETLEDHIENLPVATDFSFHAERIKAELAAQKNIRRDFQYKGIQFTKADGSLTKPEDMVVGYIPSTGSGKPNPSELESPANQTTTGRGTARSYCGPATTAVLHVDIQNTNINNQPVFNLNDFYIRVIDDNGIFSHSEIATGTFNANGDFYYPLPRCDVFSPFWGDYSRPDIYYLLEARIPNSSTSGYHQGIRIVNTLGSQHFVQSGTYWDDSSLYRAIRIDANAYWTNNTLWLAKMTQFGQDFMKTTQATPPGVGVFWPATVQFGSAYAPVARIILPGGDWVTADPVVHEYGHNVRYSTGVPGYFSGCLGAFLPCDPGFAGLFDYSHSPNWNISVPKAQNEGFAEYFYEMVKRANPTWVGVPNSPNFYSFPIPRNPSGWGEIIFRNCSSTNSCGGYSIPTGVTNESRVSSFLYRYTNEVLVCASANSPKTDSAKFSRVLNSIIDTSIGGLSQSIVGLWNSYLYTSFPDSTYCPYDTPTDFTNKRDLFKQILVETTIAVPVASGYKASTGEVVLIP